MNLLNFIKQLRLPDWALHGIFVFLERTNMPLRVYERSMKIGLKFFILYDVGNQAHSMFKMKSSYGSGWGDVG